MSSEPAPAEDGAAPQSEPAEPDAEDAAPRPVIVVGGGIAGLVLARDVARGGREVVLLEASDRLGGQVVPLRLGDVVTDAAAESFATRDGVVARLAAELGLADDIVTPRDDPAWLYREDGRTHPLPATSVLGIPGVPLAADVIAAIGGRAAFRAQLDLLLPSVVGAKAATLGELVRRRMGDDVLEQLVAPVVRGVHSAHPDDVPVERAQPRLRAELLRRGSLAHAVRVLRETAPAGSQVAGIRGGVWRLAEALETSLRRFGGDIRTGARVVEATADRVMLADGTELEGEVVLAAAGADGTEPAVRRITLVTLLVDAPGLDAAPRGTGVLVAAAAPGVEARALTHATAKWSWLGEAAAGRHVLRLSYDAAPDGGRDGAVATARRDAETLTGVPIAEVVDADVRTWARVLTGAHADGGMDDVDAGHRVGEAGASTGLAAVVAGAREAAGRLLGTDRAAASPE